MISYSIKLGPRTPPSPSQGASLPVSPRDNRKRRRTPPPSRNSADPMGYATPPKRGRKDRVIESPSERDRDYRDTTRGKSGRDRDYRDNDRFEDRRTRSPR